VREYVGLVRHHDDRGVICDLGQGRRQIVHTIGKPAVDGMPAYQGTLIAKTRDPEWLAALVQAHGIVFVDGYARRLEREPSVRRSLTASLRFVVVRLVVITQNGVHAIGRTQAAERIGPFSRRDRAGEAQHSLAGEVIAEQERAVRLQSIRTLDDALNARQVHPRLADMQIGDERYSEIEILGPIGRGDAITPHDELARLGDGITAEAEGSSGNRGTSLQQMTPRQHEQNSDLLLNPRARSVQQRRPCPGAPDLTLGLVGDPQPNR